MFLCDPLVLRHIVALHPVDTNVTNWHHLKLIIRQCDGYSARRHFEEQFDLKKGVNGLNRWDLGQSNPNLFGDSYLHYQYYLGWLQSLTRAVLLPRIPATPPRG